MGLLAELVAAVGGWITAVMNSITDVFLTPPLQATLEHLEETDLKTLSGGHQFGASQQKGTTKEDDGDEAAELSSLKPQLDQLGVPLYAVVKEDEGTEIQNFRPYFKGEIFLDEKRRFYGPRERKMGLLGFLRVGVWLSSLRAFRNGFMGNILGEGFVLGGVFVIGCERQGILLEHREKEFGDKVNTEDVIQAAKRIAKELLPLMKN